LGDERECGGRFHCGDGDVDDVSEGDSGGKKDVPRFRNPGPPPLHKALVIEN